jgi:hypothetical protein
VRATLTETVHKTYRQERRGRPGPATRYKEIATTQYTLSPDVILEHVAYDAATDDCFPLITNDRALTDAQVLAAYRYQPNLERRHHLLKSVQHAAPVLLKTATRIEALFCCQFLALLVTALIERQVRAGMVRAALKKIPLYPELRDCPAPSTERILEIFAWNVPATTSTTTTPSYRPSNPNSRPSNCRSSTYSTCPPAPTPSPRNSADNPAETCGTSVHPITNTEIARQPPASTHRPVAAQDV